LLEQVNTSNIIRPAALLRLLRKWSALVACSIALYLFAFQFLPFVSLLPGFRHAHEVITEEKVEAGAWFYVFVEKMRDIEPAMRDTLEYTPGRK
jgi:hypothetical protein